MKHAYTLALPTLLLLLAPPQTRAQAAQTEPPKPLVLTEAIPTPGVQGRFDHFGFDGKNQLFVAALEFGPGISYLIPQKKGNS